MHNFQVWRDPSDESFFVVRVNGEDITSERPGFVLVAQIQAATYLEAHLAHFGRLPPIDRTIKPLVLLFNELGYITEYSCSGHRKGGPTRDGYISLISPSTLQTRALIDCMSDILDTVDTMPRVSVEIQMVLFHQDRLEDDEWCLRLGFRTYPGPPTAADYAWLGERLREWF